MDSYKIACHTHNEALEEYMVLDKEHNFSKVLMLAIKFSDKNMASRYFI